MSRRRCRCCSISPGWNLTLRHLLPVPVGLVLQHWHLAPAMPCVLPPGSGAHVPGKMPSALGTHTRANWLPAGPALPWAPLLRSHRGRMALVGHLITIWKVTETLHMPRTRRPLSSLLTELEGSTFGLPWARLSLELHPPDHTTLHPRVA